MIPVIGHTEFRQRGLANCPAHPLRNLQPCVSHARTGRKGPGTRGWCPGKYRSAFCTPSYSLERPARKRQLILSIIYVYSHSHFHPCSNFTFTTLPLYPQSYSRSIPTPSTSILIPISILPILLPISYSFPYSLPFHFHYQ